MTPADEVQAHRRQVAALADEGVRAVLPHRDVHVAAAPGQVHEGLGHEGGAQAVKLGDALDHELEECLAICGDQRVVIFPVHLELAVRVLMVVLVRAPAEREHAVADLRDHVVAPHQRLLVVAGLGLRVGAVGDAGTVGRDEEEFALHAGLHLQALLGGAGDLCLERIARGGLHGRVVHPQVGGEPGDLRLPRQLDEAGGIGPGEQVRVGRRHVEPSGKAGKPRARLLHPADRRGRHQLRALAAEQIGVGDQEILDALVLGDTRQIARHWSRSPLFVKTRASRSVPHSVPVIPGIQSVPANGTRAIAAASMVSATRSSGSRLCRWLLPQARAMVCASSVSTAR